MQHRFPGTEYILDIANNSHLICHSRNLLLKSSNTRRLLHLPNSIIHVSVYLNLSIYDRQHLAKTFFVSKNQVGTEQYLALVEPMGNYRKSI